MAEGILGNGELQQRNKATKSDEMIIKSLVDQGISWEALIPVVKHLKERRELSLSASRDYLTGLFTRRELFERAREEVAEAKRYGHSLSVVMVDFDHFKRINDEFGHDVGDVVLTEIGSILGQSTRKPDVAGRYGGEEFVLVLPETNLKKTVTLMKRISRGISKNPVLGRFGMTMSAGCTEINPQNSTAESLIKEADAAMYVAKELGRNRLCAYSYQKDEVKCLIKDFVKHG